MSGSESTANGGGVGLPIPQELLARIMGGEGLGAVIDELTPEKLSQWGIDPKVLINKVRSWATEGQGDDVSEINQRDDGTTVWMPPDGPGVEGPAMRQGQPQQRRARAPAQGGRGMPPGAMPGAMPPGAGHPGAGPRQPRAQRREQVDPAAQARALVNAAGDQIARSAAEIPGLAVGITFRPGGRKVDVATYIYEQGGQPTTVSVGKGLSNRLGMILEAVLVDSYAKLEDDDDEEEEETEYGYDDDGYDGYDGS